MLKLQQKKKTAIKNLAKNEGLKLMNLESFSNLLSEQIKKIIYLVSF